MFPTVAATLGEVCSCGRELCWRRLGLKPCKLYLLHVLWSVWTLFEQTSYLQYDHVFRQRQETCDSFQDSYTCNCNRSCCKDWTCGTQVICGQFLFIFDNLHAKTLNCGTFRQNRKAMPKYFGHKTKLKGGDLKTRVKGNLTAIVWNGKWNLNILTNMPSSPL